MLKENSSRPVKEQSPGFLVSESISESLFQYVGNTPLVEITDLPLLSGFNVRVFAKLEMFNFGGSVKDRPALWMIQKAEEEGILSPGKILLEPTSGNTGIGLAWIGRLKGYQVKIVMPESMTEERKQMLRSYGAELILTPGALGTDGAILHAREIVHENKDYVMLDQFKNQANVQSHYESTAPEIWNELKGNINGFVAGIGTSGTITGVSRFLKERNPNITVVSVEPLPDPTKRIPGLKNLEIEEVPAIFSNQFIDYGVNIDKDLAIEVAHQLADQGSLLVGPSSGAALAGLIKFLGDNPDAAHGNYVVIFPDTGTRYLSQS